LAGGILVTPTEGKYADPLIDEVRERRRLLLARHGDDLEKLHEAILALQAKHPEKVVDRRKRRRALSSR
jgi:hypothetical protein